MPGYYFDILDLINVEASRLALKLKVLFRHIYDENSSESLPLSDTVL